MSEESTVRPASHVVELVYEAALPEFEIRGDEPSSIFEALAKTIAGVGAIEKDKENKQQGFKYRSWEAVAGEIRQACATNGLSIVPMIRKVSVVQEAGRDNTIKRKCQVSYTFAIGVKGCNTLIMVPWVGEAALTFAGDDKGVAKATTYAEKTFLIALFMVSDVETDDTDAHGETEKPPLATLPDYIDRPRKEKAEANRREAEQRQQPPPEPMTAGEAVKNTNPGTTQKEPTKQTEPTTKKAEPAKKQPVTVPTKESPAALPAEFYNRLKEAGYNIGPDLRSSMVRDQLTDMEIPNSTLIKDPMGVCDALVEVKRLSDDFAARTGGKKTLREAAAESRVLLRYEMNGTLLWKNAVRICRNWLDRHYPMPDVVDTEAVAPYGDGDDDTPLTSKDIVGVAFSDTDDVELKSVESDPFGDFLPSDSSDSEIS